MVGIVIRPPACVSFIVLLFCVIGVAVGTLVLISIKIPAKPVRPEKIDALISMLHHEDGRVRREAALVLRSIGTQALPSLMAAADDSDFQVRALVLLAMGTSLRSEAFYLDGLRDADPWVRLRSAELIREGVYDGCLIKRAVPILISMLDDVGEEVWVRCAAAEALDGFGVEARSAIPALVRALEYPDSDLQAFAAWTLESLAADRRAFSILCLRLDSPEFEVRAAAAAALGKYGLDAIGPLERILKGQDRGIADQVGFALGQIGGSGMDVLQQCYSGGDVLMRLALVRGIGNCEKADPHIEAFLIHAKNDLELDVRMTAIKVREVRKQRIQAANALQWEKQLKPLGLMFLGLLIMCWSFRSKSKEGLES